MNRLSLFFIFVIVNALGFFSVHACYVIGMKTGIISVSNPNFDPAALDIFFKSVMMTWLVCAIFSVSAFFLKGAGRIFFLAAPVVIPMAYGLKLLFLPL